MKYAILLIAIFTLSLSAVAQDYRSKQDESSMTITGTSTLHDWEIDVESFNAVARLDGEVIENASFVAEVKSLKSGTSSMDDNTYEALKAKEYPNITFKSTEVTGTDGKITVKGKLTIVGNTKPVTIPATLEKWTEGSLTVKGTYTFKMSEFGIDPPRAMLGAIRTGDEITIHFKIVLYK